MNWIAAHLYHSEPWDKLLIEAVKPFAEEIIELGLAEKFFFIRYWERGPHIRLRFYGDETTLTNLVKPKLESWFENWFRLNSSTYNFPVGYENVAVEHNWYSNDSVQWIEYEPETERYGGKDALIIAENHFEDSSNAVLAVMDETPNWSYDNSLGTAIQMHLAFAHSMGMSRIEASEFFSWVFHAWLPMAIPMGTKPEDRPSVMQTVLKAFENQFEEQQSMLLPFVEAFWEGITTGEDFEEAWINKWIGSQYKVKTELQRLDEQGKIVFPDDRSPNFDVTSKVPIESLRYWSLFSSYVHMTNNRLGVQNRDEGYLGYLLWKAL